MFSSFISGRDKHQNKRNKSNDKEQECIGIERSVDLLKSFLVGTLFVWSHTVVVFDFLQSAYVSLVSSTLCKHDGL